MKVKFSRSRSTNFSAEGFDGASPHKSAVDRGKSNEIVLPREEKLTGRWKISASILSRYTGVKIKSMTQLTEISSEIARRMSQVFSVDEAHSRRMQSYLKKRWFWPSSPIVAAVMGKSFENPEDNGKLLDTYTGSPISCFLMEVNRDNFNDTQYALNAMTRIGGGVGIVLDLPGINEKQKFGQNFGFYSHVQSLSLNMKINSGLARTMGSAVFFLDVSHSDIEAFIDARKNANDTTDEAFHIETYVHHGIKITDEFMDAVAAGADWNLRDSKGQITKTLRARDLLMKILNLRFSTGEPYIFFVGNAERALQDFQRKIGLEIRTTNLCTEITLPTGLRRDGYKCKLCAQGKKCFCKVPRHAICCLGSFNLRNFDEWKALGEEKYQQFVDDILLFYDNIITFFIHLSQKYKVGDKMNEDIYPGWLLELKKRDQEMAERAVATNHALHGAIYSAYRSRDLGLGVVGFAEYLSMHKLAFDDPKAMEAHEEIFSTLKRRIDLANEKSARLYGSCPDAIEGEAEKPIRHAYTMAVAPTSSISFHCGTSKSFEPYYRVTMDKSSEGFVPVLHPRLKQKLLAAGITDITEQVEMVNKMDPSIFDAEDLRICRDPDEYPIDVSVKFAVQRQKYIDQACSLNLFFNKNTTKSEMVKSFVDLYKGGVKTMYYAYGVVAKENDYRKQDFKSCSIGGVCESCD
jgi:ribonucleoside-diphosphate reductase alpha chain